MKLTHRAYRRLPVILVVFLVLTVLPAWGLWPDSPAGAPSGAAPVSPSALDHWV
jgi:hypothetical protein